ncbi:MAG: hypothetical protein GXO69_04500 [Acidobacteria bacterium]|nr:hypothetical protein [Acidobacteriota bacterium]
MFFNTLKREMSIHYFTQVALLTLAYFILSPGPYIPERFGLFHDFGLWHQLAPLVLPAALILYVLDSWLILSAHATLLGRAVKRADVFMYLITSVITLFLYLLSAALIYACLSPLITHLRLTALTEVPVLLSYLLLIALTAICWKWLTYLKWRTRIRYFQADGTFSKRTLLAGLSGSLHWKPFAAFLLIASATVGLPALLLLFGAYLQDAPLLAASLMAAILCYTIGKFYLLYRLWNRMAQ